MSVVGRIAALADDQSRFAGPELLPVRLTRACAEVLPVDGAGLSLYTSSEFRVPIGASDETAAVAERLQFTMGEGPCLAAHASGQVVTAGESEIRSRWPRFYDEFTTRTRYRSVVSIPLQHPLHMMAALDLYLTAAGADIGSDWTDVMTVAETVTTILLDDPRGAAASTGGGPLWLDSPPAQRRAAVWNAIGMVNVGLELDTVDALAVLRGYGYSHDCSLDDIADQLVSRRLPVEALYQAS